MKKLPVVSPSINASKPVYVIGISKEADVFS